MNPYSIT